MGIEKILQFENCPHSWPEDYPHENGKYSGKCVHCKTDFLGHKRRPSCKKCHLGHLEKRQAELEAKIDAVVEYKVIIEKALQLASKALAAIEALQPASGGE